MSKIGAHCSILNFLANADPDLHMWITQMCIAGALNATGKPGVTLLIPKDKAFRREIEKNLTSTDVDANNAAADSLFALIMRDCFKQPGDWKTKPVANALVPSQLVGVKEVTSTEVIFESGAKAVLNTQFRDASRKRNLAVWDLVSGSIPVTSDKPAPAFNKRAPKQGGYAVDSALAQSKRFKIALAVENTYAMHRMAGGPRRDVYLEHTLSLVDYIINERKDTALMFDKVLPLISGDHIDFYLLVEPHKADGRYLLDSDLIDAWWESHNKRRTDCKAILERIEAMLRDTTHEARIYSRRGDVLSAIHALRTKIRTLVEHRPRECASIIAQAYKEFVDSNELNGVSGAILPAGISEYYKSEPGLKMIHDELRYITYSGFKRIENGEFGISEFHALCNIIGEYLHASAEDRPRTHKLLNAGMIKYMIGPQANIDDAKVFLNSTAFMFIPMTCAESEALAVKNSVRRPDPDAHIVFNIAKDIHATHKRLVWDEADNASPKDIVAAIMSLDVTTIDPALLNAIRAKFGDL